MPHKSHPLLVSALMALALQGCTYSRGTFELPDGHAVKEEAVKSEGEEIPVAAAGGRTGAGGTAGSATGMTGGSSTTTGGSTSGGTTASGTATAGTTGTMGGAATGAGGTATTGTAGTAAGTTGVETSGTGGMSTPPPPEPESRRMAACYQFAYVSNREGADNIYFGSNCRSFGEWKLTANTDPGLRFHNVSLQADLSLAAADAERVSGSSTVFLGSQVWDLRSAGAATTGAFRADVNNDGSPDFETPFSLSWGEGRLMAFAAWTPDHGKQVVRLQMAADNPDATYYPLTIPNASGSMSFDKVWWFPRKYPAAGHDLLLLSARKTATSPYRLYTRDLYQRTSDDLREVLSGDEPGRSQRKPSPSSDGSKVVFVKTGPSGESTVWISGLAVTDSPDRRDPATPLRLTGDAPRLLATGDSPCLTHDGANVLFEKSGEIWMVGESGDAPATNLGIPLSPESLACSPQPPMLRAYTRESAVTITPYREPARVYRVPEELTVTLPDATGGTTTGGTSP